MSHKQEALAGSILFVGDVHLRPSTPVARIDDYCQSVLNALDWCVRAANKADARLVFGGDLGHKPDWPISLLYQTASILRRAKYLPLSAVGNHDVPGRLYTDYKRWALGILEDMGVLKVPVGRDGGSGTYVHDWIRLHFFPDSARCTEQLLAGTWDSGFKRTPGTSLAEVAIAHAPVGATDAWGMVDVKTLNIPWLDMVCFADIHDGFDPWTMESGCVAVNCGALERMTRTEYGRQPHVCLIKNAGGQLYYSYLNVPVQPPELVFNPHIVHAHQHSAAEAVAKNSSGKGFLQGVKVLQEHTQQISWQDDVRGTAVANGFTEEETQCLLTAGED